MNSNHKFTVGKYKTRDGRDAVVLADDMDEEDPLLGYIILGGKKNVACWKSSGKMFASYDSGNDLLPPPAKLRPWRPSETPVGALYRTKESANVESGYRGVITYVDDGGIPIPYGQQIVWITFDRLLATYEHSTDNGVTWKPCGVEE